MLQDKVKDYRGRREHIQLACIYQPTFGFASSIPVPFLSLLSIRADEKKEKRKLQLMFAEDWGWVGGRRFQVKILKRAGCSGFNRGLQPSSTLLQRANGKPTLLVCRLAGCFCSVPCSALMQRAALWSQSSPKPSQNKNHIQKSKKTNPASCVKTEQNTMCSYRIGTTAGSPSTSVVCEALSAAWCQELARPLWLF